ncbi:sodium:solute symporter [Bacillus aerolatus]|uniref:Sodium:solute symporter n=1 Tax=Bacillus aerolatus TaxID=2653354 RepID=A0A6I1FPB8_9BACI|nr:sodium:solute symporter [Bacillus aerolatus]KAB7708274.1 sodium:solute symporter [Bacillus aerolatus]
MNSLDILVMVAYFAVIVFFGVWGARRAKTAEDYAVAGRNLGMRLYLACVAALIIGGGSTLGTATLAYESGISGMWYLLGIGTGMVLLGVFFAKKIHGQKVTTMSEMLEKRFNVEARIISSLVSCTYTFMLTVGQVAGMGTVLHVWLGWDLALSMIVGGGAVLFYTVLGGMWSISMTDIIQLVIMTAGIFFVMLPISLSKVGGWTALHEQIPSAYFEWNSIGAAFILKSLLLYTLSIVVGQDMWQRLFTARTSKIAKYGLLGAAGYAYLYAIAVSIIGMCAFALLPQLDNPQDAFAAIAEATLPAGLFGIVVASVLSALMSTASGTLIATSTTIVNDIIIRFTKQDLNDKRVLMVSRMTTLTIGVISIILALWIQSVLVALDTAFAILSGSLFFPIVLGFFWKKTTAKAAFYSILSSSVVVVIGLILYGSSSVIPILCGLGVSLITIVSMSYLTAPSQELEMEGLDADIKG